MLRRVALIRTEVSEELSASFIRVTRIGELGTTLVTASVVHTKATRRNIPENAILHSHRREYLKSYNIVLNLYANLSLYSSRLLNI
jgi:hypothetical protein